jgi:hypothetical protein
MRETVELHRQRIPRGLLVLDAAGATLAAIGVLDLLETGPRLVPDAARFPGVGIALIVAGILIMMAVPLWLLRQYRARHRRARGGPAA